MPGHDLRGDHETVEILCVWYVPSGGFSNPIPSILHLSNLSPAAVGQLGRHGPCFAHSGHFVTLLPIRHVLAFLAKLGFFVNTTEGSVSSTFVFRDTALGLEILAKSPLGKVESSI